MGTLQKIGRVATTVAGDDNGNTVVTYHDTAVVTFNQDLITLNSGGWLSHTTKARMNQTSNVFRLGYQVFQHKYRWYVDFCGNRYWYWDKMRLDRKSGKAYKDTGRGHSFEEIQPITERLTGIVDPR